MSTQRKVTILVIDDDTNLLLSLKRVLTLCGYEVATADSAKKGQKLMKKIKPDLIILDLAMPVISGFGFLREISDPDGKPKYPVLVLTARANMQGFFSELNVDGFLEKPCTQEVLEAEIERILISRGKGTEGTDETTKTTPRSAGKVLLAEDDIRIKIKLEQKLRDAGFNVENVSDGSEIVERVIQSKPDVIAMKRILVGMNGDRAAAILGGMPETSNIPVVLYTEEEDRQSVSRLLKKATNIHSFVTDTAEGLSSIVESVLSASRRT